MKDVLMKFLYEYEKIPLNDFKKNKNGPIMACWVGKA